MSSNKILTAILIVAVLLLGGLYFSNQQMKATAQPKENVTTTVSVAETSYDWGEIGIDDGKVTAVFTISNQGDQPLQLSKVITSCACTTAQLSSAGEKSPAFGMHNKSAYIFEVPPQETAELTVIFDPAFHGPTGVGAITRQVTVATNDPSQPQLSFSVAAMVVK